MSLDETALNASIASSSFRIGVARSKWRHVKTDFPHVYFQIALPKNKPGPEWVLIRVKCDGFPAIAPTAQLWDARTNAALPDNLRPFGATGLLIQFSAWGACLYHPIDRVARDHWPGKFQELVWLPGSSIAAFLEVVHDLCNDSAYVRCDAPAAAAEMQQVPLEEIAAQAA